LKRTLQILKEQAGRVVDAVSDLTRYAAVRVPLQKANRSGEVTIDLTGYKQVNTYACGAIASAMVVTFLRPKMRFERIHAAVDPTETDGAGTMRVIRAMRSLGVTVSRKTRLTFDDICAAIDAGPPVMVWVKTKDRAIDHWVVIYGYGRKPNLVFVAGQKWRLLHKQRVAWADFRRQWASPGEGLVCWKAKVRKTVSPSRPLKKK
jgi:hypothetical protein